MSYSGYSNQETSIAETKPCVMTSKSADRMSLAISALDHLVLSTMFVITVVNTMVSSASQIREYVFSFQAYDCLPVCLLLNPRTIFFSLGSSLSLSFYLEIHRRAIRSQGPCWKMEPSSFGNQA